MARKLASIVEIESCDPIPDTERLSVATMKGKGWKVVTGRDEFRHGDLCVYFEIDAALDPTDDRYSFLRERCLRKFVSKGRNVLREVIRIKTIKLRGVVSQGLLMPLSQFPEVTDRIIWNEEKQKDEFDEGETGAGLVDVVGADLTALLHVEHYDEVKEQLQPAMGNPISADAMGPFPSALGPRSDEERIQNLGDWFETMKGRKWEVSVKADGTSCTVAYSPSVDAETPFIVCSRNLRLKREMADGKIPVYWQMAEKYGLLAKLESYYDHGGRELMLQGEIVGPGIQSCRNKEHEYTFKCFRIWDVHEQCFINPNETVEICNEMGIPHVEVVATGFPFFDEITTMDAALKYAEGKTAEGNEREGVVLKTCDDGPYYSCKIINNNYLLKQKD